MIFLITSAAYVDGELASEFGNIPPAFLPVGNRRLYEHQIEWIKKSKVEKVYISLPMGYKLSCIDQAYFDGSNVDVISPPVGVSLGESIEFCLKKISPTGAFSILHGDTLVMDINYEGGDALSVSKNEGYYSRAVVISETPYLTLSVREALEDETIVSGFFAFADSKAFQKCLHEKNMNFVSAIELYSQLYEVKLMRSERWLDFGHVTSYFRSRANITTQRSFNGLKIHQNIVIKSSCNALKMKAEYEWFCSIPAALKIFCPNILWYKELKNSSEYGLEYIYASSLSDLFVFSNHDVKTWERILSAANEFLNASAYGNIGAEKNCIAFDNLYLDKTLSRIDQFSRQTGFDILAPVKLNGYLFPSLKDTVYRVSALISPVAQRHLAVVHGDFCFSNILYSFRSQSIKVIDPRGIDADNVPTIYGDRRYDFAKLAHSAIGLYDHIIAGMASYSYSCEGGFIFDVSESEISKKIEASFIRIVLSGDVELYKEVLAINVLLFLSMLPLHSDNNHRQHLLMLNALRILNKLESEFLL